MARGSNTVTMTFSGDASSAKRALGEVEQALERVGRESDQMSEDLRHASRVSAESLDRLDDAGSNAERGLHGLNDGISGSTDLLGVFGVTAGGQVGTIATVAMGFADLGAFAADFATQIPPLLAKMGLLTVATETETGAQYALNTAFLANPIFLVVAALAALVGAFVLAYQHSETFRNIVQATLGWLRDPGVGILETVGRVVAGLATFGLSELVFRFDKVSAAVVWLWTKLSDLWVKISEIWNHVLGVGGVFGWFHDVVDGVADGIIWLWTKISELIDILGRIRFPSPPGWLTGRASQGILTGGASEVARFFGIGAEGAIVTRPTGAIIGEAGPEAVIPLNRMPGASALPGGVGGNVTVYVQSFDPAAAGRLVQEVLLDLGFRNGGRTGIR